MLKCEICEIEPQTPLLTRCCKLFICDNCRDKLEKNGNCACSKPIVKKLCATSPELFEIVKSYYEGQPQQCDRCEKASEIWCANCSMSFCTVCDQEVHDGKGFVKHNREATIKEALGCRRAAEKANKRQQCCQEHKMAVESVCDCGQFLCGGCLKVHRDSCPRFGKPKLLRDYKQEYFSQILWKVKKIAEYKDKLISDRKSYEEHFNRQREVYETSSRVIEEQLEGIRNIVNSKIKQIKAKLSSYWVECQDAHLRNCYSIDSQIKKFDDLSRLSEKFVEKTIGFEYLEKRVKRVYISQDYFNFKLQGLEDLQLAALNLSSVAKIWDFSQPEAAIRNNDQVEDKEKVLKEKKNEQNNQQATINSELFLECVQNHLKSRTLTLKSSHNQICFEFLHLTHQSDVYEIEYGVGLKMKGQEIFKKIENTNGVGTIGSLNPSTKYRVRMRVCGGQWGPIVQIKTQETPRFITEYSGNSKHAQEAVLQILKAGIIYGTNQILFGVHSWEIKIFPPKNTDEETACISIGVANKEQKKPIFVGTTLNYGYQKALLTVRVVLNCDENRMSILSSTSNQEEVYQNLPYLPIYPALQNKGSHPVQIQCSFT